LVAAGAPCANAQCGTNTLGYGNVGMVTENPFHAKIVVTRSSANEAVSTLAPRYPTQVARDSQGRVRTERATGQFLHDNGAEAGTKTEQHLIMICDPVAQTLTQIDTLNATARIFHSAPSAPSTSRTQQASARTFCSSRLLFNRAGHSEGEDLGVQTIQGVEAHGVRMNMPLRETSSVGGQVPSMTSTDNTREIWCSDQLSAVVLTVTENAKTGEKTTAAMQNIERTEPDASLFQIPPDHAITESVAEPHSSRAPGIPPR
jgi:hypothetical protein